MNKTKVDLNKELYCYIDVGGTFSDCFVMDEGGNFVSGKAPSTPHDISIGTFNAIKAVFEKLGVGRGEFYKNVNLLGFGSTVVVNTILTRKGRKTGIIITKGFEDILLMERGKQSWVSYNRIDRMHPVTHRHLEPLVPKGLIKGVTERTDGLGRILIPLYENEAHSAVNELLDQGIEALVICCLWSFLNDSNEMKLKEIAESIVEKRNLNCQIYRSVDISPVIRELSRLNAAVIEAYSSKVLMRSLSAMEANLKEYGFLGNLQIMQSSGGVAQPKLIKAVETLNSGPVGGIMGARYMGDIYDEKNIISADMGGTSFDLGLINNGEVEIDRDPICAGMILGIPMIEILSIGAGGGTKAYIDTLTGRLNVGPDSAGADPGPVCYDKGGTVVTVTDADLLLGYINEDNFIGGKIKLNKRKAEEFLKQQIADLLNIDLIEAAAGIRQLIDVRMKNTISGLVEARGLEISEYTLVAFGGAGGTHVEGFTKDLPLRGVMFFPYSAVFSAFGAATLPYQHYYTRSINMVIPASASDDIKMECGRRINKVWSELKNIAIKQIREERISEEKMSYRYIAQIRYGRQLQDLLVTSPVSRIKTPEDWNKLIDAFENLYSNKYAKIATYPQAGFEIFNIGLVCYQYLVKPRINKAEIVRTKFKKNAFIGERKAFFYGDYYDTKIFDSNCLLPGNIIEGPAIIEDPTTTFVIPPAKSLEIDEYKTYWLK